MTDPKKLLSCPFCGGEARVKYIETVNHILDRNIVQCTRCGAQSVETPTSATGEKMCVVLWNRRCNRGT